MARFDDELLLAAEHLLSREPKKRGRLPEARVRRSISTAYYALFHFLIDEASRGLIGTHNDLLQRRRMFVRMFTHAGLKATLEKVLKEDVHPAVADFFRRRSRGTGPVKSQAWARNLAEAFLDAQAKRHDADYNMNEPLSELDARGLINSVRSVVAAWRSATSAEANDFKDALFMLMVLKGQLRAT